jgi:hypothetical protein
VPEKIRLGPAAVIFLAVVALIWGLAASAPASAPGQRQTSSPPPASGEVPVHALVDATGAAIVLAGRSGGLQVVGVGRGSGVQWRAVLPAGATPIGCVTCPTVMVTNRQGQLGVLRDGSLNWLGPAPADQSTALGVPGFALLKHSDALATDAGPSALRLRVLGEPHRALTTTLAAAGVVMPLTTFQQSHSALAVSANTAGGIAQLDVLHPGELCIVEQTGARTGWTGSSRAVPPPCRTRPTSRPACRETDLDSDSCSRTAPG